MPHKAKGKANLILQSVAQFLTCKWSASNAVGILLSRYAKSVKYAANEVFDLTRRMSCSYPAPPGDQNSKDEEAGDGQAGAVQSKAENVGQ